MGGCRAANRAARHSSPLPLPQVREATASETAAAIAQFGALASLFARDAGGGSAGSSALPIAARPELRPDLGEAAAVVERLRRRKGTTDEGACPRSRRGLGR